MKQAELYDVGVNITSSQFADKQQDIIARANEAHVTRMLFIGCDIEDSITAKKYAQKFNQLCTFGVHPHNAKDVSLGFTEYLRAHYQSKHIVAVGECGLDYNRDFSPRQQQRAVFEEQVALAKALSLPLYMHERDASDDFYDIAKLSHGHGVVHCFTGNRSALSKYIALGFHIGITGWVCDERRGQELQELVKYLPLDRLLVETDAPYLLPRNIRPKPKSRKNEPSYLPYVIQTIAELKKLSFEQVAQASFDNAATLFSMSSERGG